MANDPYEFADEVIDLASEYLESEDRLRTDFCGSNLKHFPELEEKIQFLLWANLNQQLGHNRAAAPLSELANVEVSSPNVFANVESFSKRFAAEGVLGAGEGMFGQIVRCTEVETGRKVAIKKIRGNAESALAEAKMVASLSNQHIVQIYQVIRVGEQVLLVYEYLNGLSLAKQIQSGRQFPPNQVVQLVRKIALGLGAAHAVKIVHSDIKPENIVLVGSEPKIVDFGLAYSVQGQENNLRVPRGGTPCYKSPEHESGAPTGVQGDVFALGVLMYQLLTGSHPYTPDQILNPAFSPVFVRSLNPEVSRDVEAICMKCIERSPSRRFSDGTEVASEIERQLESRVLACRPNTSTVERIGKSFKRNKLQFLTFAIVSIIAASLLYAFFSERAKYNAEIAKVEAIQSRKDEEKKRRLAAEAHLYEIAMLNARRAGQRGQWSEMLESLDEASSIPTHDSVTVDFARVTALDALEQNDERDELVEKLLASPRKLATGMKGSLLLWKADVAEMEGRCSDADALIRQAIDAGLSDSDICYAKAIQAETIPDSISQLEECIQLNRRDPTRPYHFRANAKLAVEYFLMARRKDARKQCTEMMFAFPDDFQFPFLLGLIDVLDGDLNAAIVRMESSQEISEENATISIDVYRILSQAVVDGELPAFSAILQLVRGVMSLMGRSSSGISTASLLKYSTVLFGVSNTASAKFEIPRRMKALLIHGIQFAFLKDSNALHEIARIMPEPSVRFADMNALKEDTKEFYLEALKKMKEDINKEYHVSAIKTYSADGIANISFHKAKGFPVELQEEIEGYLNDHSPVPGPYFSQTIRGIYASQSGDHELANHYFYQHLMKDPTFKLDRGNCAIWAAYSALKVGDYCRALKMASYVKKLPRRSPPMSLEEIRQEASAGMRNILEKHESSSE